MIGINLPPLPSPFGIVDPSEACECGIYDLKDLHDYAKAYAMAAIEADRQRRGEPVEWPLASKEEADMGWTLDYRFLEQVEKVASQRTDFTTSMEAAEQVLISAAELLRAPQPAEPVKVPGDEDLIELSAECERMPGGIGMFRINYARALLARYGQPADPSGASTLHNADSGAQNGIHAPQPQQQARGEPAFYVNARILDSVTGKIKTDVNDPLTWSEKPVGNWQVPVYTAPQIPEGYKLVPIEPTPEMLKSGWAENDVPLALRWKAMLEAAPQSKDK